MSLLQSGKKELVEALQYFVDVVNDNVSVEVIRYCEDGVFAQSKALIAKHGE
jgi:hypothetical protein